MLGIRRCIAPAADASWKAKADGLQTNTLSARGYEVVFSVQYVPFTLFSVFPALV